MRPHCFLQVLQPERSGGCCFAEVYAHLLVFDLTGTIAIGNVFDQDAQHQYIVNKAVIALHCI